MASKEIVTLQLGHYANFVGTHWWNIQESSFQYKETPGIEKSCVDHDVLFREGCTKRGAITFTPRVIITELKGALGSLKKTGTLYDDGSRQFMSDDIFWDGDTIVHQQATETRNRFLEDLDLVTREPSSDGDKTREAVFPQNGTSSYNLEQDVSVWSDFSCVHLHPKSVVTINEYTHGSETDAFDLWSKGGMLNNILAELEERIRFYAEECDLMQGFHVLSDMHSGFAGLSSSLLLYLSEEFPAKQKIVFPCYPTSFSSDSILKKRKRRLNNALSISSLVETSSLLCPLSLCSDDDSQHIRDVPCFLYNASFNYHTSAVLAATLDSLTVNYRLKNNLGTTLQQFCDNTTSGSRNLVSLGIAFPLNLSRERTSWSDFLQCHMGRDPWTLLTPNMEKSVHKHEVVDDFYSQYCTVRGFPHSNIFQNDASNFSSSTDVFRHCQSIEDMLKVYLHIRFPGSHHTVQCYQEPLKISLPFPQLFYNETPKANQIPSSFFHNPGPTGIKHQSQTNGNDQYRNCDHASTSHQNSIKEASHRNIKCEYVPVMTNIECSSKLMHVMKNALDYLSKCKKRDFAWHCLDSESMDIEIERLRTLQGEYESTIKIDSSDSDEDI